MGYIYNFPISMLRGFMAETDSVLDSILDFNIWQEYEKCEDIEVVKTRLGITISNKDKTLESGKRLSKKYRYDGYPWTGISHKLFWEFFREDRSDFDKAALLGFLAAKSLIGGKPYYKLTNQSVLQKRMAGYKEKDRCEIPKELKHFTTRWFFDRIKLELKENFGVVIYANHVRGMYISTSLSLEQLAVEAEENKLKTRLKAQAQASVQAKREALQYLGMISEPPTH